MSRNHENSEWRRLAGDLKTDRALATRAVSDSKAFDGLMEKYEVAVKDYVRYVSNRDKAPPEEIAERIDPVWHEIQREMSDKLRVAWRTGRHGFRELLLETTHLVLHGWSKPEIRRLMAPKPDEEERRVWARRMRDVVLAAAWERLRSYQREGGNQYHAILKLRENNPDQSSKVLAAKLPPRNGVHRLDEDAFRKGLDRARELFGRYLCDEAEASYHENVVLSAEDLRGLFLEMDLMDYAEKSEYARMRLGLNAD